MKIKLDLYLGKSPAYRTNSVFTKLFIRAKSVEKSQRLQSLRDAFKPWQPSG